MTRNELEVKTKTELEAIAKKMDHSNPAIFSKEELVNWIWEKRFDSGFENAVLAAVSSEVVDRYGSAVKEHYVAYSGIDNETGKHLKRGLKHTAESKVNPEYHDQNIKQQAGYAAEDKYVARQNANKIINGDSSRVVRTDDIGRVNDPLLDHIQIDSEGIIIRGTEEQMKFVGSNPKACLDKLASPKFEKYLDADAKITVPSDYYKGIIEEADKSINKLQKQLEHARMDNDQSRIDLLTERINKYEKIKANVKDSGITNKEAIFAREHPKLSTAIDVAHVAHRAGIEQAKIGAAVSGGISLIQNIVSVTKGDKTPGEAAWSVTKDVAKGAATSYATAFAGSSLKGAMQNSANSTIRSLAKTNIATTIVTSTIEVGKTLKKFINGEISGTDCLVELGEKGTAQLSSAMFAAIGQVVIPIPVVGAMIGSMVGYALSTALYGEVVKSFKEAKLAREERIRVEKECDQIMKMINQYRAEMKAKMDAEFNFLKSSLLEGVSMMDEALESGDIDTFIGGVNKITTTLGGKPRFTSFERYKAMVIAKQNR